MYVYVAGKRFSLDPSQSIGKGGEADVYDIGQGEALKLFKTAKHPDLVGNLLEQQAAAERLQTHQEKLPALLQLASRLPDSVVKPRSLATDREGKMVQGYTMEFLKGAEVLLRYSDKAFRQGGVSNETVVQIFLKLHQTVSQLHAAGLVIGDFNDLNVLVRGVNPHLLDLDSAQFGKYLCRMFTQRFVDPLLCDPNLSSLMLSKPHNENSDWYAFAVMLMQCLLFVDPYGGIHKPQDRTKKVKEPQRPLHRITVFHPEVQYPKPATPYAVLPDRMLQELHRVFVEDQRGVFPLELLQELHWTTCSQCGLEYSRAVCPVCAQVRPGLVKEVTQVRGTVTATRFFQTKGLILRAAYQAGQLYWLYHEDDTYKRDQDGRVVMSGALNPQIRYRISDQATLIAHGNRLITLRPGQQPEQLSVDIYGNLPVFDANERKRYWVNAGQLLMDGRLGQEYIGDVLQRQTLFWVGPSFGFGFYRAGTMSIAFVFDADHRGLNDSVKLTGFSGQLVDSTCFFTNQYCWFLVSLQDQGKIINRCYLVKPDGSVKATASSLQGDGSWLGSLRGKCAAGNFLLAATDEGIVRVEVNGDQLAVAKEFPDTEPFVTSASHLFPGKQGLYVVDPKEIRLLKIATQ